MDIHVESDGKIPGVLSRIANTEGQLNSDTEIGE